MPVEVRLDLDSFRTGGGDRSEGIEGQLLQAAILATPLPGTSRPLQDYPASPGGLPSPLDRLTTAPRRNSRSSRRPAPTTDQEQP